MPLNLERKKAIVSEISGLAKESLSLVVADYRGLTAEQMTNLRAQARTMGVLLKVVRNTLTRRAFEGTQFECMQETLQEPVILAFAKEEPSAGAKLLQAFAKENERLEIKALSLGDVLLGKEQLSVIASLPTREEALSKLLGTLQAPITKFVRTLAEPHAKLVRVLSAIKAQKESST